MIKFRLRSLIAAWEIKNNEQLTLEKLSRLTGINRSTLSRMAGSADHNTTIKNIDTLCEFFGCTVGDLMEHVPSSGYGSDNHKGSTKKES